MAIKNRADWNTYNEIFVRGDYNWAINHSLQKINTETEVFRFLDLGANVGFFSFKLIDSIAKTNCKHPRFEGLLVEGSPKVYRQLKRRVETEPISNGQLNLVHGLVGKRQGSAKIFESSNYITNSLFSSSSLRRNLSGTEVQYVDIDNVEMQAGNIDLLKCDIEGSELEFLENYEELLKKVKVAVFEMHHTKCDTKKCFDIISRNGLVNRKTIVTYGDSVSIEVFWR